MHVLQKNWLQITIIIIWTVINSLVWWEAPGDDLSSIYIAANLLHEGNKDALYEHDSTLFHVVNSTNWQTIANKKDFQGFLHPFVHIPIVATMATPLASNLTFSDFKHIVLLFSLIALASSLVLISKLWAPTLFKPINLALTLILLSLLEPVRYSLFLVQTQPLIFLATLASIWASLKNKSIWAGILLAVATIVKITPMVIVGYWLFTKRTKAAVSFFISLVSLILASVLFNGITTNLDYLKRLMEISHITLAAFNNQSFSAWAIRLFLPKEEVFNWHIYNMPTVLSFISIMLITMSLLLTIIYFKRNEGKVSLIDLDCICISLLLLMSTVFAPIAWSHYFIMLPLLLTALLIILKNSQFKYIFIALVIGLNLQPLAIDSINLASTIFSITSAQFYSALIVASIILSYLTRTPLHPHARRQ